MNGLKSVLYVRVDNDLIRGLDRMAVVAGKKSPGRKVTRSDIAREILLKEIAKKKRRREV